MKLNELAKMSPKEVRELIREGEVNMPTSGMSEGYLQANLAILPKKYAYDFLLFAQRNPKPCPILEVLDEGSSLTKIMADGADIKTDVPKYRIYRNGEFEKEVTDLKDVWQDDFVTFVIGCSFSFEKAMLEADVPVRHIEDEHNVPMYITNIECESAGVFHGNTVVSMRPIPYKDIVKATTVTARFPATHGAPIHIGDPSVIGIKNIDEPDFGERSEIKEGEVPVFWACGVTPQAVAMASKPDIMITHAPGHMLILDKKDAYVSVF
ncbi:uncharacterized protein YcsI (UPF0317 family) [Peptoniphilus olsenii]|uniref:Putative hydro-lyase ABID14_001564 n=1 Tax=Peptoniphilus olsenii TaxID=411570 RepID=A0ABV2JDQ7_9FIRM